MNARSPSYLGCTSVVDVSDGCGLVLKYTTCRMKYTQRPTTPPFTFALPQDFQTFVNRSTLTLSVRQAPSKPNKTLSNSLWISFTVDPMPAELRSSGMRVVPNCRGRWTSTLLLGTERAEHTAHVDNTFQSSGITARVAQDFIVT